MRTVNAIICTTAFYLNHLEYFLELLHIKRTISMEIYFYFHFSITIFSLGNRNFEPFFVCCFVLNVFTLSLIRWFILLYIYYHYALSYGWKMKSPENSAQIAMTNVSVVHLFVFLHQFSQQWIERKKMNAIFDGIIIILWICEMNGNGINKKKKKTITRRNFYRNHLKTLNILFLNEFKTVVAIMAVDVEHWNFSFTGNRHYLSFSIAL